ncbi:M23 family metallopeptidase [Solicola gregarius]|uniref:M23 family metallopeptidase n=1 Tax=Solicola gregarius TaxID=2908642 RepID=A0AA46TFK8_9ACTN|nr:M23 family metallopeptidase [Solicola gregarius]UYM04419.1 M23 family metallopeptidase [Solicola gregarius]
MKALLVPLVTVPLTLSAIGPPAHADTGWVWPLDPRPAVVEAFDPPVDDYGAGHRGVDLAGATGDDVRAVAPGTVTFVGSIAGVGVITIDHGDTDSTYQPVDATVSRGDAVDAGEQIGTLLDVGSHCAPDACLHLGRVLADEYADPLELLPSSSAVRLVTPFGPPPEAPATPIGPIDGDGRLAMPVEGPVTSPYGMRLHPILGIWKLHDGTDFGVGCGTPVRSAEDGTVTQTYADSAYGNRVIVDHGDIAGSAVTTSYNHLTSWAVSAGEAVRRGDVVGYVGSTGYSTACHLHFMVEVNGSTVDPETWL